MASTKAWKGFLKFGVLNVPIFLNVGARDSKQISFNNLHSKCNSQLKAPKYCPTCDERVPDDEVIKGYETPTGFIRINKTEIDSMAPASEKVIEISDCVKWEDVDPLYLAESFYVLPDQPGLKAYSLLVKSLTETGRVGLAQVSKNNREHLVLIRPKGNGLMLHYLWYANEVNRVPEFDELQPASLSPAEVKLGAKLVESLASDFQPEHFRNGFEERVAQLIASKMDETVQAPTPIQSTQNIAPADLMEALKASLAQPRPRRQITLEHAVPVKSNKKKKRAA